MAARPRGTWLGQLPAINVRLALLTLIAIALLNSPVVDPWRLSIASQLGQARSDGDLPDENVLHYLRFESGRPGYHALQGLLNAPWITEAPDHIAAVQQMLAQDDPMNHSRNNPVEAAEHKTLTSTDELRGYLQLAPGAVASDEWLAWLLTQQQSSPCLTGDGSCVVLTLDLDHDGQAEQLLCDQVGSFAVECGVSSPDTHGWRSIGAYTISERRGQSLKALETGEVNVAFSRWPDLVVNGEHIKLGGAHD